MAKRKKAKKTVVNVEVWTEEQYEEYMKELYDMEFIAGFTEGGVPYGIFNDDDDDIDITDGYSNISDNDELPF